MLYSLFHPRSVAIIGASTKELSIGNVITKNLLHYKFTGSIYPINPTAPEVRGLKAYPSILDCPGNVDLVHISIPAKFVPQAIEDCGRKGVKHIIINSAGFKEVGPEGEALEMESVSIAKKYSMRIFGPNCQGIINTDPNYRAYCDFTFTYPKPGNISIVAQSGGVGAVLMQRFYDLGVGMRFYASNGNACDISIPEIIEYYGEDEQTNVIVLYIEAFTDPIEFMNIAKKVSEKKPILAMRAGRTEEGAKAAISHTGGLAGAGLSIELIFKKCGIVIFRDEEEMCQSAIAFSSQPIPKGNSVGIITDTGGPAIIATDVLIESGLRLPDISPEGKNSLKEKLYPEAAIGNPIDVLATAQASHWRAAMDCLMNEEVIDSVYLNFVTPPFVDCEAVAKEMAEISCIRKKPVICNYMTDKQQWLGTTEILKSGGIPCYDFPEMAAKAIASLVNYRNILNREKDYSVPHYDYDRPAVKEMLRLALKDGRELLNLCEVFELLNYCDIKCARWLYAENTNDAIRATGRLEFPLVLKADSDKIIHKSDAGAVVLDIKSKAEFHAAIENMNEKFSGIKINYLIQEYIQGHREIIIGAVKEKGIGHILMFGLGGIFVELLKDVAFELTPVTKTEALAMINGIKASRLLYGYRGEKAIDIQIIVDLILKVSQLVMENPEIEEIDLNPMKLSEDKAIVVDARIKISSK